MLKGQPLKLGGAWTSADADPGPNFYLERNRVGKTPNDALDTIKFIGYLSDSKRASSTGNTFNLLANDFKADLLLALSTNVALQSTAPIEAAGTTKLYGMTSSERYLVFNLLEGKNNPLALPTIYARGIGNSEEEEEPLAAGIHLAYATQLYWSLAVLLESTGRLDLGGPLKPLSEAQAQAGNTAKRVGVVADLASQHYRSYLTSGTEPFEAQEYEEDADVGTFYADNLVAAGLYHRDLMDAYATLSSIYLEKRSRPRRFASLSHYEAATVAGIAILPDYDSRFETAIRPTITPKAAKGLFAKVEPIFTNTKDNALARPSPYSSRIHVLDTPQHMASTQYTRDDGESDAAGRSPAVLQVRYQDSAAPLPVERSALLAIDETTSPNAYYTNSYVQYEVMELHGAVGRLDLGGGDTSLMSADEFDAASASARLVDQLLQDAHYRNPQEELPMHPGDYLGGLEQHTYHNHWTTMALWEHTPFLEWHRNLTGLFLQNALNWIVMQSIEARTLELMGGKKATPRVEAMVGAALDQISTALLYGNRSSQYISVYMSMYHEEEAVAEHTPILREEMITYILWTFQIQLDQERFSKAAATGRTKQPSEVEAEASLRNVAPEYVAPLTEGIASDRLTSLYAEMLSSIRAVRLDYRILYEAIRIFWLHTTDAIFSPTIDEPRIRAFITTHLRNVFHRNFDERDGFQGPPRAKKIRRPDDAATLGVFVILEDEDTDQEEGGGGGGGGDTPVSERASREYMARMVSHIITSVVKDLINRDLTHTLRTNTIAAYEAYTAAFFGKAQKSDDDDRAVPVDLSSYVQRGMVKRVNREVDRMVDRFVRETLRKQTIAMMARHITMLYGGATLVDAMRDKTDDDLSSFEDDQTNEAIVEVLDAYIFLNGVSYEDMIVIYSEALTQASAWGFTKDTNKGLRNGKNPAAYLQVYVLTALPSLARTPLVAVYPHTRAPDLGSDNDQKPEPAVFSSNNDALLKGPFSSASMWASLRQDMPLLIMLLYDRLKYCYKSAAARRQLTLMNLDRSGNQLPLAYSHPERALPGYTNSIAVDLPPDVQNSRRWRTNTFSSWLRQGPLFDRQLAYMHRMMKHDEYALAADRRDLSIPFMWERTEADIEATLTYVAPRDAKLARILWQVNSVTVRAFYATLGVAQGPERDVRWFKTKLRISRASASAKDTAIDRSLDNTLLISCGVQFYWDAAGSFPSPVQCNSYASVKSQHKRPTNSSRLYKGPRVSDVMHRIGRNADEERQLGMLREQLLIDNIRRKAEGRENVVDPVEARYYSNLYHHTALYWPSQILRESIDQDLAPTRPFDTTISYGGDNGKASQRAKEFVFAKVMQ